VRRLFSEFQNSLPTPLNVVIIRKSFVTVQPDI